jgi:Bacterial membrane protein YfhO
MPPVLPALGAVAIYGAAAFLALTLARRWILPISRRAGLLLAAAPLLLTGRAMFSGGIVAPLDVAYRAEPLHAIAGLHGAATDRNPLLVDVVSQMLPWRQAVRASLARGRLPLWNRYVLSGEPLLGVGQPAVFHPATGIGLALPLPEGWNVDLSLRLLIALASAYVFFAGTGAAEGPALLGAFAWAFSDFLFFYVGYPMSSSVGPFPLLLLGLVRLAEGGGRRAMGLTTAALVLCVVAGHPETLLFAVAAGGVFFLAELVPASPGRRLGPVLRALGAGALALGLSAVVLLPLLEALPQTLQHALRALPEAWGSRTAPAGEVLRRLVPSLVPYAFGAPGRGNLVGRLILPAAYAGSLLWPFAAAGLAAPGRRRWIFAAFVAGGLAVNARVSGIAGPLSKVPLFDLAVNDYFVFVAVFGLAGLGVLGAERLRRGEGAGAFVAGAFAAAAVVGVVAAVRAKGLSFLGIDREFLRNHILLQTVPPLAAAAFVGFARRRHTLGGRVVAVLVLAFVVQRALEENGTYPTFPRSAFYPPLRVLDPIPRGSPVRMAALGYSFAPNIAAMYGVEDVRGYEAMTLKAYTDTYPFWCRSLPSSYNLVTDASSPWLAFLGVRYVLVPPSMIAPAGWRILAEENGSRLVENPKALARAFAPEHVAWVGDRDLALAVIQSIGDFARDGVVGAAQPGPPGWLPNGPARVEVAASGEDRMTVTIDSTSPVFVGTSVPRWIGWRLTLDGSAAPLLAFNHAFLGFQVPAGRHEARLRYRPGSFVFGGAVSAATALLAAGLWLREGLRRRRAPARGEPAPA